MTNWRSSVNRLSRRIGLDPQLKRLKRDIQGRQVVLDAALPGMGAASAHRPLLASVRTIHKREGCDLDCPGNMGKSAAGYVFPGEAMISRRIHAAANADLNINRGLSFAHRPPFIHSIKPDLFFQESLS